MKFLSLAAASALVATTATLVVSSSQNEEELFDSFITKFNKPYKNDNTERAKRFNIFKRNLEVAAEQQKKNPLATFGVNLFSDLSEAEFKTYHNGAKAYEQVASQFSSMPKFTPKIKNLKDAGWEIDWTAKGAVTNVKNQGQCGSCWSFSITGVVEGQWFLAGHPLTSLSEEFFVDCDSSDDGCNGGLPSRGLNWVIGYDQGKIPTEASYPYNAGGGQAGSCKKTGWTVGAVVQGQRAVEQNEPAMWGTLYGDGPISIGVDATTWQTYAGGIMTNCPANQLDHGVLITGINLKHSPPYWVIKNSWTTEWGENGYLRLKYGTNECGLTTAPVMAIINTTSAPTPAPLPPTVAPTPAPPTTQAPATPDSAGWMNLFPPPGETYFSESTGIAMLGPRDVYLTGMVAGSGPNVGPQIGHFDGNVQGNFYTLKGEGLPFLEMELAVGGNPMEPKGATCGIEFPVIDKSPFAYFANSTTILPSTIVNPKSFMSVVQGCEASADGNWIIGADQGSGGDKMQALLSKDAGKTFTPLPFGNVNIPAPAVNCSFPRYATIASENVMYVTLGDWGSNNTGVSAHWQNMHNIENNIHEYHITATRKRVRDPKTGKSKTVVTGPLDVYNSYNKLRAEASSGSSSSGSNYCGNSAEILRTADGGKTWTSVFSSIDKFYFNEIACASETNCVAVGEGFNEDAGGRIYQTEDGVNWKRVLFLPDSSAFAYSFFAVEVADAFNGHYWVGATKQLPDRQSSGLFYHSTDFGKTWSEYRHNIPSLVEIMQISFSAESFGSVGFAIAMDQFQASTILRWDTKGKLPTQTYFTQKTCFVAGCEALCQQIEFPQRLCVRASGGGAVEAYVDGQNLVQTLYQTTSCEGAGKQSTIPLNKCMKNQQGQYFEFTAYSGEKNSASNHHTPRKMYNPDSDKVIVM